MVSTEFKSFKFQQNLNDVCYNSSSNELRCIPMPRTTFRVLQHKRNYFDLLFKSRVITNEPNGPLLGSLCDYTQLWCFPFDSPKLASVLCSLSLSHCPFFTLCVYLNIVHFTLVFVTSVWTRVEYQLVDTSTWLASPCVSHPFFSFYFRFEKLSIFIASQKLCGHRITVTYL